jgi:protein required for attachment to host cells
MEKTWILVANSSRATLYGYTPSNTKPGLQVLGEFEHIQSRKSDSELVTDREGAYQSYGGHGNFIEQTDPHKHEAEVFARELYTKLEEGRTSHQFQDLILIAAPHFMGLLRSCIDGRPFKNVSIKEIQKDYTQEKPHSLIKILNLK